MRKSIALLLVGAIAGLSLGWVLYHPSGRHKIDPPAPAIRQSDGSLVLERKSDPTAKAPAEIPAGARVERIERVVVQPNIEPRQPDPTDPVKPESVSAPPLCGPAEVDLSLLKMRDKTERVVASSPDGKIVGGVDIPVAPEPAIAKIPRWTISGLRGYDVSRGTAAWGGAVSYARGPFVLQGGAIGSTTFAGIGIRF